MTGGPAYLQESQVSEKSNGKLYNVAVVGATGLVGQEFLRILAGRHFPLRNLRLLARQRSAGPGRRVSSMSRWWGRIHGTWA